MSESYPGSSESGSSYRQSYTSRGESPQLQGESYSSKSYSANTSSAVSVPRSAATSIEKLRVLLKEFETDLVSFAKTPDFKTDLVSVLRAAIIANESKFINGELGVNAGNIHEIVLHQLTKSRVSEYTKLKNNDSRAELSAIFEAKKQLDMERNSALKYW